MTIDSPELGPGVLEALVVLSELVDAGLGTEGVDLAEGDAALDDEGAGDGVKLGGDHHNQRVFRSDGLEGVVDDEEAGEIAGMGDEDDPGSARLVVAGHWEELGAEGGE